MVDPTRQRMKLRYDDDDDARTVMQAVSEGDDWMVVKRQTVV